MEENAILMNAYIVMKENISNNCEAPPLSTYSLSFLVDVLFLHNK